VAGLVPVTRPDWPGLAEAPQLDSPNRFPAWVVTEFNSLTRKLSTATGTRLICRNGAGGSRLEVLPLLRGVCVRRWLADEALRLRRHRSSISLMTMLRVRGARPPGKYQHTREGKR
jgi:hypothetical protein